MMVELAHATTGRNEAAFEVREDKSAKGERTTNNEHKPNIRDKAIVYF